MEFQIKCLLGYEVSEPASFLFNVAVAQNSFQRIITEHLEVAGAESCQEMLIGGQRYHRVTAQHGSIALIYEYTTAPISNYPSTAQPEKQSASGRG